MNYGLHIVGRRELASSYPSDLRCLRGHYHRQDTQVSFLSAVREAVSTFRGWCARPPNKRGAWATAGLKGDRLRDCSN